MGQENAYGSSAFASLDAGTKLSLSGGVDAYYAVLRNNGPDLSYAARNVGAVVSGRLYGSYALPRHWGVQVFGFYRGAAGAVARLPEQLCRIWHEPEARICQVGQPGLRGRKLLLAPQHRPHRN